MFLRVVEAGSISKAAAALRLAPISVKRQVDSLESTLGAQLLVRTNQGISLTEIGRDFFERAKSIELKAHEARVDVLRKEHNNRIPIHIASSLLRPCDPLITMWETNAPGDSPFDLVIVPFTDNDKEVNDLLLRLGTDIDCFLSPCDSEEWIRDFSIYYLEPTSVCIGVPKSHPLAKQESLELADLEGESICIPMDANFPTMGSIANLMQSHGNISIIPTSAHMEMDVFNNAVRNGNLIVNLGIWGSVHPLIKNIPMQWDYVMPCGIIYSKSPSPNMLTFIKTITLS